LQNRLLLCRHLFK